MKTRIIGTGSAVPQTELTNEDLSRFLDTSDTWIRTRTGIGRRQLAGESESVVSLAAEAGKNAMENSKARPEGIDLVLVATCSSENYFPSAACQVQALLGLENAAAMDLSAACSGFLFAFHTAHAYLEAGIYKTVLVIGAETLSRVLDWRDRSTCVLFGDGAGACVVTRAETGLIDFVQGSNGKKGSVLRGRAGSRQTPACRAQEGEALHMDGPEVFKFAVKKIPECIEELLEKNSIEKCEVKYYILHQANSRIICAAAKRLGQPEEKFPVNIGMHGNTSAASIPILLDEMNRKGELVPGDLLVLCGFGAGLTWGADLIRW